jgi:ubiquinone/menaquinone biosynthesis C-methylase UbiE
MKTISKPWDWKKTNDELWNQPSEESYYLVKRWKDKNYESFLDLGCGLGRNSILFATNNFKVDSFDLSEDAINSLNFKINELGLNNIVCTHGDMHDLPYKNDSFDCLLAYHVVSHTDTNGIKKIINEINRVLRNGSEFFITLCSKKSWSFVEAGYPEHDENTVIKIEDGPENGIPHFFSDEKTMKDLLGVFSLINVKHTNDIIFRGSELQNSWHYFILGAKA